MIDDIDDDDATVLIDFEQEVHLVRLIEGTFIPTKLTIRSEIFPGEDLDDEQFDIAISKVRWWLDRVVSRCIAFARGNPAAMKMLIDTEGRNISDNLLMLCPSEPTDEQMATLLQSKLTSLAGGHLVFGSVEVRSNNMHGLLFRFVGNSASVLPNMDEWVGPHTYFPEPWWLRDDASSLDVIPPEDADLTERPKWAYKLDFLETVGQSSGDVVLQPNFNPTVIDGGQADD